MSSFNVSPSLSRRIAVLLFVPFLIVLNTFPNSAEAADTSLIPDKPTSTIRLVSGETYDFGGRTIDGGSITLDGLFRCFNSQRVTLVNVVVTNSPRYAFLARNCVNATIRNFRMTNMHNSVGGIRFDIAGSSNGLTLDNISGSNIGGQGVEVWNADGFNIGNVSIDNTPSGCALLLNQCRNGRVGTVTGTGNNPSGGMATFRLANNNGPNIRVRSVVSRNCGRGFFSLTGSFGATVESVTIVNASREGIFIENSSNTTVLGGECPRIIELPYPRRVREPDCRQLRWSDSSMIFPKLLIYE